ncbi:MAG: D-2-hydroxyacid dehydrogenase [Acidobacteriota bacterium]|nr:D-2-hydroxyacid dehydrogenase [Acidobacteriota bacterium]
MRLLLALAAISVLTLPAQTKKILLSGGDPQMLADLSGVSDKVRIVPVTPANVMQEIRDADAFVGEPTPEMVRAGKNLKWVQIMAAGVERALYLSGTNDLRDSNIVVTNNRIVQGPEIADHAMALLLTLSRGLNHFIADDKSETWNPRNYHGIELNGKTAVIIGVGGIGQQIATRAWAFGMNVIGVDPQDYPMSPFIKRMVKPDQLDDVLPEADVLFISAPHTEKSHKMVGAKEFALLKKGSYFVAVSRGGVYDMNGLVKALDEQRLAGAGVDVVDPEPLPKGHPLWKFENAIITPHIAGRSDRDHARMVNTVKENVARFADGRPLINVVDKQRGY